jgi:hypothetical protein
MERKKRKLRSMLRIAWIGLVFVLVLEFSARIEDSLKWGAPFFGSYSRSNLWTTDSLGKHGRPNAHFEKWRLNSHGFRGPEISVKKPEGVIRVIVLGASETFGLYESPGMEFPAQIQKILDEREPGRFQVINAAVAGITLPTITRYFDLRIKKFDPDVIILYPTPVNYLLVDPPGREGGTDPQITKKSIPASRILRKIRGAAQRFIPRKIKDRMNIYLHSRYIRRITRQHQPGWTWQESFPPERLELFKEHLLEFIQKIQDNDVQLILATHANRFSGKMTQDDRAHMLQWMRFHPRASQECILNFDSAANRIIRSASIEENIYAADIDSILTGFNLNFSDFAHFTDLGASVVSELFANAVLQIQH